MERLGEIKKHFNKNQLLYTSIKRAFYDLYRYDKYLIYNEPSSEQSAVTEGKHYVGERSIVFRFAHYLQNELLKSKKYAAYNLDCEYNRNINGAKTLPGFMNGTFPDLIVHKRGNNRNNLLVMEFKTYWNSATDDDKEKVAQYVKKKEYRYKYGIVVVIGKTLAEIEFEVFT